MRACRFVMSTLGTYRQYVWYGMVPVLLQIHCHRVCMVRLLKTPRQWQALVHQIKQGVVVVVHCIHTMTIVQQSPLPQFFLRYRTLRQLHTDMQSSVNDECTVLEDGLSVDGAASRSSENGVENFADLPLVSLIIPTLPETTRIPLPVQIMSDNPSNNGKR